MDSLISTLCSIIEQILSLGLGKNARLACNDNKILWIFYKKISTDVLNFDGIIFGGYVRDKIAKEKHSKDYYSYCMSRSMSKSEIDNEYNNADFNETSYIGRTLIPSDIDVFFEKYEEYENFCEFIFPKYHNVTKIRTSDPRTYIPTLKIPDNSIIYHKIELYMVNFKIINDFIKLLKIIKNNFVFPIIIDFIIYICSYIICNFRYKISLDIFVKAPNYQLNIQPPFGDPDFTSNSLTLSKHGLGMYGGFDANKLMDILAEISNFETTVINPSKLSLYRINHMCKKRIWNIKGSTNILLIKDVGELECVICRNNFSETKSKIAFRLKCCSQAVYHSNCLLTACTKGSTAMKSTRICISCKQSIDSNTIDNI